MRTNEILEEIWRIKDELARQADYDVGKLCEQTRKWAAEHPHDGPVVHNAEELRRLLGQEGEERKEESTSCL